MQSQLEDLVQTDAQQEENLSGHPVAAEWQAEYERHTEFASAVRRAAIGECIAAVEMQAGLYAIKRDQAFSAKNMERHERMEHYRDAADWIAGILEGLKEPLRQIEEPRLSGDTATAKGESSA